MAVKKEVECFESLRQKHKTYPFTYLNNQKKRVRVIYADTNFFNRSMLT